MDDEDKRTIWCGNLHENVSEDILYELFLQGGPVQKVSIPKDRDGKQKTFGFVTYKHECSVPYALDLFDGTTLFNRQVHMKSRNNTLENSYQQQQFRMQQMQARNHDQYQPQYDQRRQVFHNELQLGQQVLMGSVSTAGLAASNMFMMPGNLSYPSQTSSYSQNPQSDYSRGNRQSRRNHPYQNYDQNRDYDRDRDRDRDRDHHGRHNNRQDTYDRNSKSHKNSSYRSNRHEDKRRHR